MGLYTGRTSTITLLPRATPVGSVRSSEPGIEPRGVPTHEGRSSSMGDDQLAPPSVLRMQKALQCVALQVRTSVN